MGPKEQCELKLPAAPRSSLLNSGSDLPLTSHAVHTHPENSVTCRGQDRTLATGDASVCIAFRPWVDAHCCPQPDLLLSSVNSTLSSPTSQCHTARALAIMTPSPLSSVADPNVRRRPEWVQNRPSKRVAVLTVLEQFPSACLRSWAERM